MDVVRALLSAGAMVNLQSNNGCSPLHTACYRGHQEVVHALLSAGGRADLRAKNGLTPLDLLPCALRPEVERLLEQRAKEERMAARVNEGVVDTAMAPDLDLAGAARAPDPDPAAATAPDLDLAGAAPDPGASAVTPPARAHGKPTSKGGSSEGGHSAEGGGGSGGAAGSLHVCSMCGGPPSALPSGNGAKLKACGRCRSVHYCSQEFQKKHWGEGGHKQACPGLQEARERKKGAGAGD